MTGGNPSRAPAALALHNRRGDEVGDAERLGEGASDRGEPERLADLSAARADGRHVDRGVLRRDLIDPVTADERPSVLPVVELPTERALDRVEIRPPPGDGD